MKASLTLILSFFLFSLFAQNTFNLRYHFGYPASVLTSVEANDSCYYASGVFADSVFPYRKSNIFIKFGLNGELIWSKTLTNTNKTFETWKNTLTPTFNGNFINAGYSVDSTMKLIFIKYNNEGDTLFTREYFNPYYPVESFITLQGLKIDPIDSSNLIVSTIFHPFNQANYIYLFKTDINGDVIWDKVVYKDIELNNSPRTLEVLPNSEYLIGAGINNLNIQNNNYTYQTYIHKTDSSGNEIWEYVSPENELQNAARDILPTSDGGYVIASGKGVEYISGPNSQLRWHLYIYKLDANRNFVWGTDFRDTIPAPDNYFNKIIASPDGTGYVAAGTIFEFTGGGGYNVNGIISKVSTNGDSLWTRYYNYVDSPADTHAFYDIEETSDGGFIMVGQATDHFAGGEQPLQQSWLVKLDQYGCLVPGCNLIDDVEELVADIKLDLYPNPTFDFLNIFYYDPNHRGKVDFRIVDVQGRELQSFSSEGNNITHIISLDKYPDGQYFLTVDNGKDVVSKPFLVVR